jgi:hypothetical protein
MEEKEREMDRKEQGESRALGKTSPAPSTPSPPYLFSNLADNFNNLRINRLQNGPYHNVKLLNLRLWPISGFYR